MSTKKSIRNFNEKPAKLFIGKTIEKPGSDTLITLRASGPVFCCYRFFQLPLPRLLLGDFSISDLRNLGGKAGALGAINFASKKIEEQDIQVKK